MTDEPDSADSDAAEMHARRILVHLGMDPDDERVMLVAAHVRRAMDTTDDSGSDEDVEMLRRSVKIKEAENAALRAVVDHIQSVSWIIVQNFGPTSPQARWN